MCTIWNPFPKEGNKRFDEVKYYNTNVWMSIGMWLGFCEQRGKYVYFLGLYLSFHTQLNITSN